MPRPLPVIGITLGDPRGIGPEVVQKALRSARVQKICRPILFGDPQYFDYQKVRHLSPTACGKIAGQAIEEACQAAKSGAIEALVTAPISKDHLNRAGYHYPGHTEFLADRFGAKEVRMMMAGPRLKVVLVTIHEPLARVSSCLTVQNIFETIRITRESLRNWWGIKEPRIAVAALNPHAGEAGMFGHEEKEIIQPTVSKAHKKGWKVFGPFSPDTVFYRAVKGEFNVVVAMYHDQGLIPLKLLHFDEAVNITLGLPVVRTSVDHGTAFDIAGKNLADPSSLIAAIEMAVKLARRVSEDRRDEFISRGDRSKR